jgi:hypothetical protein
LQVVALTKQVELLSKTRGAADGGDPAPGTPTQQQPSTPTARRLLGGAAAVADGAAARASGGGRQGASPADDAAAPSLRRRVAELERQRDDALAALVAEARPMLKAPAVLGQLNAEVAAEVKEAADAAGLEAAGAEQLLQALLALRAGALALRAGEEAQRGLQDK